MTSSDYPSNPNKQLQLMMNLSLLSSLKQKQPLPQIPQVTYVQPSTTPSNPLDYLYRNSSTTAQPITVTQMSYHSIYSPHSTILSYKRDDNIDLNAHVAYTPHYYLHTSNPSQYQHHKSYTAMSYHIPHNIYQPTCSGITTVLEGVNGRCEVLALGSNLVHWEQCHQV